jgi:hypothetical protein
MNLACHRWNPQCIQKTRPYLPNRLLHFWRRYVNSSLYYQFIIKVCWSVQQSPGPMPQMNCVPQESENNKNVRLEQPCGKRVSIHELWLVRQDPKLRLRGGDDAQESGGCGNCIKTCLLCGLWTREPSHHKHGFHPVLKAEISTLFFLAACFENILVLLLVGN